MLPLLTVLPCFPPGCHLWADSCPKWLQCLICQTACAFFKWRRGLGRWKVMNHGMLFPRTPEHLPRMHDLISHWIIFGWAKFAACQMNQHTNWHYHETIHFTIGILKAVLVWAPYSFPLFLFLLFFFFFFFFLAHHSFMVFAMSVMGSLEGWAQLHVHVVLEPPVDMPWKSSERICFCLLFKCLY